jgi:hypothetical protein
MSLVRIAARIAAVEALKGKTLVGNNVLDRQIGALEVAADGSLRTDEQRPFIAVYTDSGGTKGDADTTLRAMLVNGPTEILFEAGITAAMVLTDENTGESVVHAGIPATDQAFEFYLDLVARQIGDALTDPGNAWAEIFRRLCCGFRDVERARTSSDRDGVRLAGQQIKITVDLIADPLRGAPIKKAHPLAVFFAKVAADGNQDQQAQIALMQVAMTGAEFTWQLTQRRYGMTAGEMNKLLLAPAAGAEPDIEVVEINTAPAEPVQP